MNAERYSEGGSDHWRSQKITPRHLDRLAIVYVRQSTLQQVADHQESTRLQYGLVERAVALGWTESRVRVIDQDLGKSGSSTVGREGFAQLVSEVGLNHVGLILGLEMSRLARSSKDWHQLLEICALFNTLIADYDGLYDPSEYNDRLLLGLHGMMSEAELHVLKQRLHQGKLNKARRGELTFPLPIGYIRRASGEVTFDPDAQVQQVVRLIFRKFAELGTLHALVRYLTRHDIRLGIRLREGFNKGELEWRNANRMTLQNLLKNPIYAGAYAYGRRQSDPRKQQPGRPRTGRVSCSPDDYHAWIKDHFPAYISWAQYEQNLAQLQANRAHAESLGAIRHGPSLLTGLLVCGSCGARMFVRYGGPRALHSYVCSREATDYGGDNCQYLPGPALDSFVSQWVLKALEPAALELSLEAATHLERERAELDQLWQQRLERAAFDADRAARHYRFCEPENRLVARQLAQEWEEKLTAQQQLQEDYRRFCKQRPRPLSAAERETIRQLAQNLPALWHASSTTVAERKAILRLIIRQIRVASEGSSERIQISLDWASGNQSVGVAIRPISRVENLSYYPQLCERLRQLTAEGLYVVGIAERLAQEGYRTPRNKTSFQPKEIRKLMNRLGLRRPLHRQRSGLKPNEWWLADLARALKMPNSTLYQWLRRGELQADQQTNSHRWIIRADQAELERLKQRRALSTGEQTHRQWLDATASSNTTQSPTVGA
jgi:DNA invertase Pin-like site-specific DNA recombinase